MAYSPFMRSVFAALLAFLVSCGNGNVVPPPGGDYDADPAPDAPSFDAGGDAAPSCGTKGGSCCAESLCQAGLVCRALVCTSAVQPSTCANGAPAWAFVSEVAPPAAMEPYERFTMFVTLRNCSGATVPRADAGMPTGLKLGFSAPRDYDPFGLSRVALPADVPNASEVTIPIVLRAPPLTGAIFLRWGLVDEGKAWLPAESPAHTVDVRALAKMATVCPNVTADIGGGVSARQAVATCIANTAPGGVLDLPGGVYRIDGELSIDKPITIRTAGTAVGSPDCWDHDSPACAVLRADDNLAAARGFFYVRAASGVHLDRIVLDGNRGARLASAAAATCAAGNNGAGFNAHSDNCSGCSFARGMSARALCGTGWEWTGNLATIERNVFYQNGDHNTNMMWSDGLTLLGSDGATVRANRFVDNSDIDFISGGAANATFEGNYVHHVLQGSFGGLMLDNFNGGTSGNFALAQVKANAIDCGPQLCDFGIELGPHPWYLSANIQGGTVTGNSVSGAKIQINAEGAGTAGQPIAVSGNVLGPSPASAVFGCGQTRAATAFNVSPDSFVTTADGTGKLVFHGCP